MTTLRTPLSLAATPLLVCALLAWCLGCAPEATSSDGAASETAVSSPGSESSETSGSDNAVQPAMEWALAIHGGAGVIPKDLPEDEVKVRREALERALRHGQERLAAGASSIDVVEEVVTMLEDEPLFNAGKGAVFTNDERHELDAAIMDGRDLSCGAVARLSNIKNPITLARAVMDQSKHVFMAGEGAEAFAAELGYETVGQEYFHTDMRYQQLQRALEREREADKYGTVGCVARDRDGNLAAATSTGGMTNKRFGRIGDVPVIGAGTYADNRTAAISCTGKGEEFIRRSVAHQVTARMAHGGVSLDEAARAVIHEELQEGDGGLIAVDAEGRLALIFNTPGMYRGAADSSGRFDVAIWENP